MSDTLWKKTFAAVHARGTAAWNAGRRSPESMFDEEDVAFLKSIGCSTQEMFDYIEDLQDWGEPDLETIEDIQQVRLDYFHEVMHRQHSARVASMSELPSKAEAVDGISWLPRLIVKARLKLRGEMPPELMYGCGGDRPFLRRMNMSLGHFLRLVWECGEDDRKIVEALKRSASLR